MDEKLKKKWIKALRSGEYKQARHALKTEHGFCCLGVLCDIQKVEWKGRYVAGSRADITPPPVRDAGLTLAEAANLAEMNDGYASFNRIARYIETNL